MRAFRPRGSSALLPFVCLTLLWPQPGRAADYLTDAERLLRQGALRGAQIQLRNAVKFDPQNADAHFRLARLTLELGDPFAAEREARAARERGYEPRAVLPVLARAYLAQGKYKQVLQEFAPGNQDAELDADALVFRGYAEAGLGRPEDARRDFAQAAARAPQQAAPHLAAARLTASRNELGPALAELERALAVEPECADALVLKAQILRAKSEMDAALRSAEDALARKPDLLAARLSGPRS